MKLTAVYRKVPEGYIGFVEEIPGANTQGDTLEEARANLQEAAAMLIEENRASIEEATQDGEVIREAIDIDENRIAFDAPNAFAPQRIA